MPITILDGILLFIMLISAVLAMIRGFTREVFSIASWVAAAVAAYLFWDDVLPYTRQYIEDDTLSLGVTLAGIFFVTLLVVSFITMRISDFILDSKAGPLDRTLGFIFGAARGLILVVIAVLFLNFFIAPDQQPVWISEAKSKPWLDSLGQDLLAALPEDPEGEIMERIRGGTEQAATPATPEGEAGAGADFAPDDQTAVDREIEANPPEQTQQPAEPERTEPPAE
jgi:membrane protein required for colicin V production